MDTPVDDVALPTTVTGLGSSSPAPKLSDGSVPLIFLTGSTIKMKCEDELMMWIEMMESYSKR